MTYRLKAPQRPVVAKENTSFEKIENVVNPPQRPTVSASCKLSLQPILEPKPPKIPITKLPATLVVPLPAFKRTNAILLIHANATPSLPRSEIPRARKKRQINPSCDISRFFAAVFKRHHGRSVESRKNAYFRLRHPPAGLFVVNRRNQNDGDALVIRQCAPEKNGVAVFFEPERPFLAGDRLYRLTCDRLAEISAADAAPLKQQRRQNRGRWGS